MEYKDFFSPKTLEKLDKKSAENLKTMLGDKTLMQTMVSSQQLLSQISQAEVPYKSQLEKLAVDMVKELYPIIDEEGIVLDAKIGDLSSVGSELDEIKINKPGKELTRKEWSELINGQQNKVENFLVKLGYPKNSRHLYVVEKNLKSNEKSQLQKILKQNLTESISPESRRRIINAITQGAALRGAFAFYLFKEHLDDIDPSLVEKYNQIMKNSFGIYDDENAIAMMLSLLAQGQKMAGGSSKVILKEAKSGITIKARAINFPMLVHELIKGLYELISLQGFKGSKEERQAVVDKVDLLKNEPSDIRYGKFIYDALNKIFINSEYNDPRIREFFLADVYQLDDDEFISFIENAINEELTSTQQKWANDTLRDISIDLKADDYEATGLDEIKINKPLADPKLLSLLNAKKELKNLIGKEISPLNLKLGKYNISGNEQGVELTWEEGSKLLSSTTKQNATSFFNNILNIEPYKIYIGIVPRKEGKAAKSFYIVGEYNNIPLIIARKETASPGAGQTFLVSPTYKDKFHNYSNFYGDESNEEIKQKIINNFGLNINEIKIEKPFTYDKAYGESHSYDEFIKNIKLKKQTPGNYLVDLSKNKIIASFTGWNVPSWAFKAENATNKNYRVLSTSAVTNPPPYLDGPDIDIYDINSWEPSNIANSLIRKYNTINEIKINKSFIKKLLESFDKTIKTAIENKTLDPNTYLPLKEYSEKTITTTIERWKAADPNTDENVAKQLIQRFDQIKSGLAQKLDIVVLPDELKKGNNYLNIDKYSYEDMVNLIKSLPENPEKVKKDAIKKFIEKEQIDQNTAQSYVARFIANRDKIKFGAKEGLEDAGFTKEEVLNYIPKRLQRQEAFLDPRNWDWASFEQMLDALFPSQKQAKEGEENLVSTDADKIYDKNGIEIYRGDDVHKCISYNPINPETKRKKYGWCVTQTNNTNYDYYRFKETSPTFYFVFDRSKNSSPQHAPFDDQWHAFVIQVLINNKGYIVTGADNRGDIPVDSWEDISKVVPSDTWAKIKDLKDYFKPISLSAVERGRKFASGKDLSVDEFKELSQDEKILYIQGKASKNKLTPDILNILPQYKINLEGRSTTLANVAIDARQKFPYAALKDNEALAKRYAVVSSRYYPDDPLPLPFIKYLDEDAKEKYLAKYDENLTFEYIEKYFGAKSAEKYVNEQAKKLDYLPQAAFKYIKDPQLKQLYLVYSKLFDSWIFNSNTNISEKELDNFQEMPEQSIAPIPMDQKQWSSLTTLERKVIIDLIEKYNKNTKYLTLLYALPFLVEDQGKKYVLLPKSTSNADYDSWVIMDENGKIIKDNISGDIELNNTPLATGYPDEETNYNRIYNIKDLK